MYVTGLKLLKGIKSGLFKENTAPVFFPNNNEMNIISHFLWDFRNNIRRIIMFKCCRNCHKIDCKLRTCKNCRYVLYCSRKCQKNDWNQHKLKCKTQGH